jgi:hypothetical protein
MMSRKVADSTITTPKTSRTYARKSARLFILDPPTVRARLYLSQWVQTGCSGAIGWVGGGEGGGVREERGFKLLPPLMFGTHPLGRQQGNLVGTNNNTDETVQICRLAMTSSGVYSIMMVNSAQHGEGGGSRPSLYLPSRTKLWCTLQL